jgi:hypothetical protein
MLPEQDFPAWNSTFLPLKITILLSIMLLSRIEYYLDKYSLSLSPFIHRQKVFINNIQFLIFVCSF